MDVVVLGGGPAGMSAALALAREGFSVAAFERTNYDAQRLGETLPPWIIRPLARLGVWETFLAAEHQQAPTIISDWGSTGISSKDFIFNPHGPGWHLDRTRFDRMLADAAQASGVSVYRSTRALTCSRSSRGRWRVLIRSGEARLLVEAGWLVDASGRASAFARRLGGGRRDYDRLVALVGLGLSASRHSQTTIEACESGWWYAATLPAGRAVAALFTDADLLPRDPAARRAMWREALKATRLTSALFGESTAPDRLKLVAAGSGKLASAAGAGWLAVGDANQSHDPLSGQGVAKALLSGLAAAHTIKAQRGGDGSAVERFAAASALQFEQYLQERSKHYGAENRWPGSAFWRRRGVIS